MLSIDSARWGELQGLYGQHYDPRPALERIEAMKETEAAWHELWEELHHQGDVSEVSYAVVPQIVRIYRHHDSVDWNTYAIVSIIDLARGCGKNPAVPAWLTEEYLAAIRELAEIGTADLPIARDPDVVRAILAVIALAKDLRVHAMFLIKYSGDELLEIAPQR